MTTNLLLEISSNESCRIGLLFRSTLPLELHFNSLRPPRLYSKLRGPFFSLPSPTHHDIIIMKQSSKVSPSSPNEKLKKARDLWTSSIPELPVTEVDPTIWERAQGFLPHGQWLVIFYRFFLFSMMIAFVYAKMDYQRNYEAAQLFDHYFPEEDFDSVKTQGDFFHWLDRVSKTAFEDSMGNYNGHDIGLHMHHFDYLTFAIQVSQIREDFMPLCKDPFIKKNTGRANIQKMLKFFGYNCSKDYRGIPGHPRFFYRPCTLLPF